jgi:pimeloyl-ACP methyl ester carboxylesterase
MMTTGSVEVGGARLVYHRRAASTGGPAEPVVLLHPWFGCWQFWRQTVEDLPELETYSVDLYSLGAGPDWRRFAGPQGLAEAVGAMLDGLRIERCSIVGNSMGGIAAQALAAARGDQIGRLILVGTGARTTGLRPEFRQAVDQWIAGGPDPAITERLVDALIARRPAPEEFDQFVEMVVNANKAFMGAVLNSAFALDLRPELPKITAPTLIVRGELDAARTRAHVEELLAGIPNSTALEIAHAGHSPQVDSPEAFSRALRGFLLA